MSPTPVRSRLSFLPLSFPFFLYSPPLHFLLMFNNPFCPHVGFFLCPRTSPGLTKNSPCFPYEYFSLSKSTQFGTLLQPTRLSTPFDALVKIVFPSRTSPQLLRQMAVWGFADAIGCVFFFVQTLPSHAPPKTLQTSVIPLLPTQYTSFPPVFC